MEKEKNKIQTNIPTNNQLVHNFGPMSASIFTHKLFVILIAAAILGIGSGYGLSREAVSKTDINKGEAVKRSSEVEEGVIVGSDDTKTFRDVAEGLLKAGGIDGEGAYHLERTGGESRYVYLTSSIVDLSKFLNRKIKVWGETQQAKKAGWLMDVGRIEVLE